jgi:putative component of membrane protein insertase Oxa1/YidC/SpoIIIJ protein YidD
MQIVPKYFLYHYLAMMSRLLALCLILISTADVCSQDNDMMILKRAITVKASIMTNKENVSQRQLKFPTRQMFNFYRNVISEQLSADCAYDLTCSRFSVMSIKRFGIIKGVFLTADRLTRCHPLVSQEVALINFNNHTGKVIDEPDMY